MVAAAAGAHSVELAVRELVPAPPLAPAEPTPTEVRAWAVSQGIPVSDRGRVKREVVEAFRAARLA